jgi:hypothetical protein
MIDQVPAMDPDSPVADSTDRADTDQQAHQTHGGTEGRYDAAPEALS